MQSHYRPLTTLLKEEGVNGGIVSYRISRGQTTGQRITLFYNVQIITPTKLKDGCFEAKLKYRGYFQCLTIVKYHFSSVNITWGPTGVHISLLASSPKQNITLLSYRSRTCLCFSQDNKHSKNNTALRFDCIKY